MKKRLLAFVLAAVMLFGSVPTQAFATGEPAGQPDLLLTATDPTESVPTTAPVTPSDSTEGTTAPTVPGESTEATDPSVPGESTEATDPSVPAESTEATDPSVPRESTEATDPSVPEESTEATEPEDGPMLLAFDRNTGYPTDLSDDLYIAIYDGTGFPGEPAWYPYNNYTFFNSNFNSGMSTFTSQASTVLKEEILDNLTQGATTSDGIKVWGYYNAYGTKDMFVAGSPLTLPENELKIIRAIKGRNATLDDYEIIWYVIKFQTDTYWHIDGLVVRKNTYNVNYYGNGNTGGDAPTGATGLALGYDYTVLGKNTLEKRSGSQSWVFTGWNTQPDGSGTPYQPGEIIDIQGNVSLYAQWAPPAIDVTVSKHWQDNNDALGLRPVSVTVKLLANGEDTGKSVNLPYNGYWTYTFEDLDAVDSTQKLITYSVEETTQDAVYITSYSGNQTDGLIVTNTLRDDLPEMTDQPGKVYITGNKYWLDRNNADGTRPASITVNLYANGTKVASQEVTGPDWYWAFDISNGVVLNGQTVNPAEVTLTVGEESVAGYELGNVVQPNVVFTPPSVSGGWTPTNPCNSLNWYSTETSWTVVAAKTTGNGPVVIWTPVALAPYERDLIIESLEASVNGLNDNYQFYSGQGTGGYGIVVNSTELRFTDTSDWSKFYTGTYSVGRLSSLSTSITNIRQEPVTVTKRWDDANDQDGKRPASVTVHLVDSNGEHVFESPTVLNAANNWTYEWNVPLYDDNGNALVYSVYEETVPGYSAVVTGDAINGFTVTNHYAPETVKVNAAKVWNDDHNQDGVRPSGVLLQLYADGEPVGDPVTVNDANSWTHQWENLQKNRTKTTDSGDAVAIVYTVEEVGYLDANGSHMSAEDAAALGYTSSYKDAVSSTDANLNLITITNTRQSATTKVAVSKVWEDDDNRDGLQPDSITVSLYADGIFTGRTMTITADDGWAGIFVNLPQYAGGKAIRYTVRETPVEHYTAEITGDAATGFVVTNTHIPETTSVSVTKVWEDNRNQDGIRPASITVALYADGSPTGDTLTLEAANNWTASFTDLDVYVDGQVGSKITYTVKETMADEEAIVENDDGTFSIPVRTGHITGYTGTVTGSAEDGYTITNVHTPDEKILNVSKVWGDGNNQDGKRPYAVEITLFINGVPTEQKLVLTGNETGATRFPGTFPLYSGGALLSYSVQETAYQMTEGGEWIQGVPASYGDTYSYNRSDPSNTYAVVTNSYTPLTRNLTVEKFWDDNDNQDGLRPANISIKLQKTNVVDNPTENDWVDTGRSATLSSRNEWQYVFVGLPEYEAGKKLIYRVVEAPVDGYEDPTYAISEDLTHITVTNTHTPAKTQVTVTKKWEDGNDQDGLRPEQITVELYADSVTTNIAVALDESNAWTYTFDNLPLNYGGKAIVYTVKELAVPGYTTGYDAEIADDGTTALTVTNTHEPATITVPVVKEWKDNNNNDGLRPASLTVTLQKKVGENGQWTDVANSELTLLEENLWVGEYTDLPVYENGEKIAYRVVEEAIPHYNLNDQGVAQDVVVELGNGTQFKLTNTHIDQTVTVTAHKVWNDDENNDGHRPESITLHLLASNQHVVDPETGEHLHSVTLKPGASGVWPSHTWENLPMYMDGQEIRYIVTEEAVPGYNTEYDFKRSENDTVITATITNTNSPDTRNVTVEKLWNDAYNQDNLRPESIRVKLVENTTGVEGDWHDVLDASGNVMTLDVQRSNGWVGTFTDLPVFKDQVEIRYNIVEIGYTPVNGTYTEGLLYGENSAGYRVDQVTGDLEVTNTHVPYTGDLQVTKVWDDNNDQDGLRDESTQLTVTLYANNTNTGKTVTLNADNDWTATFEDLNIHYGLAQNVRYSVVESTPDGYTASYSVSNVTLTKDGTAQIIITNTHEPEKTQVSVTKAWEDGNNQDGIRPANITVELLADGISAGTWELNARNNWTHTFTGLDKYKGGEEILYTVREIKADGEPITLQEDGTFVIDPPNTENLRWLSGYTGVVTGTAQTGYTITNTHEPDMMKIFVQKNWNDNEDNDNKRPGFVQVTLYVNGQPTNYQVTLTGNETAPTQIGTEAFPRFYRGQRISYTIFETAYKENEADAWISGVPTGYTRTYSYNVEDQANPVATVTNSYTPETFNLQVEKSWLDSDNQDGIRPAAVTVTLYGRLKAAQGEAEGEWINSGKSQVLTADSLWTATFTNLSRYQNKQEIEYKIVETAVDGYEADYDYDWVNNIAHVTNTHTPVTTELTITKEWVDGNNQDGLRPDEIIFQLYRNGIPQQTYSYVDDAGATQTVPAIVTLKQNADGTWPEHVFDNLPVFFQGRSAVYRVVETAVPGYTTGYSASFTAKLNDAGEPVDGNIVILNTHTPAVMDITVNKEWQDNDNNDGLRPASITVNLEQSLDGGSTWTDTGKTLTIDTETENSDTFTDLPVKAAGVDILYRVVEEAVEHYNEDLNGVAQSQTVMVNGNTVTLTNVHTPETTSLTAQKIWNDDNDRDGRRPEEIHVYLLADDNVVPNQTKILSEDSQDVVIRDGKIFLEWTDLPKYDHGREIIYTVFEDVDDLKIENVSPQPGTSRIADRYVATYKRDAEDPSLIVMTNTYIPETVDLAVMKVWHDDNNRDGIRSASVTMTLHEVTQKDAQGNILATEAVAGVAPVVLSAENQWHATWRGLPKYELDAEGKGGKLVEYTVVESGAHADYNKTAEGEAGAPLVSFDERIGLFTVTNTYTPATTQISVSKIWEDQDNNDGIRPNGIVVQLRANGTTVEGAVAELDADNNWSHTFGANDGLTLYVKQNVQGTVSDVEYDVVEIGYVDADGNRVLNARDPVSGYTPTYQVDGYTVTITNTHALEKRDITVNKHWDDEDDNDGMRPISVQVQLYKDGVADGPAVYLSEYNDWTYTWRNKYVYQGGQEIVYTVQELEVKNYTAEITGSMEDGFTITNTHEPEVWETDITKVWKDNNSSRRPTSVTVQLYKDGVAYGDTFNITKEDGWKYPVELPVYEDGEKIEWTVKETKVPTNYNVSYDQDTLTITNRIKSSSSNPKTGDFSAIGAWTGLMGTSGVGAAVLMLLKRKKREDEDR